MNRVLNTAVWVIACGAIAAGLTTAADGVRHFRDPGQFHERPPFGLYYFNSPGGTGIGLGIFLMGGGILVLSKFRV